ALVYLVNERLRQSAFGRTIRVIREDEMMAASLGRDVYRFQLTVMMLGSAVAALSGVAYAHYITYVSPEAFLSVETFFIWIMVLLGGRGNNFGAIVGATILQTVSESTRFIAEWIHVSPILVANLRVMAFGLILIVLV